MQEMARRAFEAADLPLDQHAINNAIEMIVAGGDLAAELVNAILARASPVAVALHVDILAEEDLQSPPAFTPIGFLSTPPGTYTKCFTPDLLRVLV
jgi:hypothetical protein